LFSNTSHCDFRHRGQIVGWTVARGKVLQCVTPFARKRICINDRNAVSASVHKQALGTTFVIRASASAAASLQ